MAKTPAMSVSTGGEEREGELVYVPTGYARPRHLDLRHGRDRRRRPDRQGRDHRGDADAGQGRRHHRQGGASPPSSSVPASGSTRGSAPRSGARPTSTRWAGSRRSRSSPSITAEGAAADRAGDSRATAASPSRPISIPAGGRSRSSSPRSEGSALPEEFVLVHGHLDGWHYGVGDNAVGDATLLELARVFQQHQRRPDSGACASPGGAGTRTGATPARPGTPTPSPSTWPRTAWPRSTATRPAAAGRRSSTT